MDLTRLRVAGWRGGDLLTFGAIYLGVAVSVGISPGYMPDLVHTHLPVWFRILLWAAPAVVGIACGWSRSSRLQGLGFGLLAFAPAERMLSYLAGATFYGNEARWPGTVVYLGFLLFVLRAARRPEPVEPGELPPILRGAK